MDCTPTPLYAAPRSIAPQPEEEESLHKNDASLFQNLHDVGVGKIEKDPKRLSSRVNKESRFDHDLFGFFARAFECESPLGADRDMSLVKAGFMHADEFSGSASHAFEELVTLGKSERKVADSDGLCALRACCQEDFCKRCGEFRYISLVGVEGVSLKEALDGCLHGQHGNLLFRRHIVRFEGRRHFGSISIFAPKVKQNQLFAGVYMDAIGFERKEILRMLADGFIDLRAALDRVTEAEALERPAGGGWSVLDCLEHLAITERELLTGAQVAVPATERQHNPVREAKILDRALDRARFIAAPDVVLPASRFHSVDEALAAFESVRAETVRFVEEFEGDPRSWLTTHPMVRGPVNCFEMFLMIALHPKRHAQQILVTRAMAAAGGGRGEQTPT
jgi:hypothetical protein